MAAQDTPALVSLNYILASVKAYLQVDDKQDEFLMQLIIDCVTDLNIFHADISGQKTVTLNVSAINTVDLPVDFQDYICIGYSVGNQIVSLSYNPRLAIPQTQDCGEDSSPYPLTGNIELPISRQYGAAGITTKQYKIDKRNRRIILSGSIPNSQVIMEYIGSGISNDTLVPRYAVPAIRAYVILMRIDNDPRVPYNEKERKTHLYVTELRRLREFETRMTVDEIVDSLMLGIRQTIKR
jgi:hypothetical protein